MYVRRKSTGLILSLDAAAKIGAGGEADVFAVPGTEHLVAKIYRLPDIHHGRKIEAMLSSTPENLKGILSRVAIAWPVDMLLKANGNQSCIGFGVLRHSIGFAMLPKQSWVKLGAWMMRLIVAVDPQSEMTRLLRL